MASTPNLSNPSHEFDKTKQYNKVVFQQGKPILDVDLNDMSAALQAQANSALIEKMGYGPSQLDYREWAMTAVSSVTPLSDRNKDNFSLTLGHLDTRKGVLDTSSYRSADALSPSVIFDYGKIVDQTVTDANDRPYANYILRGVVGSGSSTTKVSDQEKAFNSNHILTQYDQTEVITPSYANVSSTTKSDQTRATNNHVVRVREGACRIRFITGNLVGQERDIEAVASTVLNFASNPLASAPDVGSEYVVLPPNTLSAYRNLYNAANTQDASTSEGLLGLPKLVTYIQTFEEDISSTEDSDIQSSSLGFETTHRSQLRWCIRVAMVNSSVDNDPGYAGVSASLGTEHIFALLTDNKFVDYQVLLDSTDATASLHNSYEQSLFWAQTDSTGARTDNLLGDQESPFGDLGLTPSHFFNANEHKVDNMFWSFLKGLFLKVHGQFNDFVILNVFNSESKSSVPANETLSEYFVPGAQTDTTANPIVHAFLSTGSAFQRVAGDVNALPASFKSPARIFNTHADLSSDNMKSRTLHGLRGGIIYGTTAGAPLVFPSTSSHLALVDQMLLGMSGLGSAQGSTKTGERVPSAIDFTLANTTASLAQSGTGVGAIKMISPISASTISAGSTGSFLTGSSSYLLREKGSRASHTVNVDDADLGWSLYKAEEGNLVDPATNRSDLTLRGWEEGMAQAAAFQQGINFRKLAIKTTAHKSMDLFTISEQPAQFNNDIGSVRNQKASSLAFMIPEDQKNPTNGNLFIDSYSGSARDFIIQGHPTLGNNDFTAYNFIPSNVDQFDVKPLLQNNYKVSGGVKGFDALANQERDLARNYGPWNRFNAGSIFGSANFTSDTNTLSVVNDLWSNRCTAMRLRYHVGDFYPGADDARGVPRNLLVDSLNLFMKVEPLSLAHWMTMPKHQHSILENSVSFAEGIEALLKVAHGLGDTQKLINGSDQPLIQSNSPALTEGGDYQTRSVGDVDPLNLPFEHYKQPFVHWYHPMMHKIKAPHPDGTNTTYTNTSNVDYDITVYPKFGRRSLIVPALVPSIFGTTVQTDGVNDQSMPTVRSDAQGNYFPAQLGTSSENDVEEGFTVDISGETTAVKIENGSSILPYPYHGTNPSTDTGTTTYSADTGSITVRNNQITFPAIGTHGDPLSPGPVFLPASRVYAQQVGSTNELKVGFNPLMTDSLFTQWNDVSSLEDDNFPYDEKSTYYELEAGGAAELPIAFQKEYASWSTPVLRSSVNTNTVAGIIDLVRTSFDTGLEDLTLSSDYNFTLPASASVGNQVPAIGPDNPLDTLFVGDMGTALGGLGNRKGFLSPLTLGVPMSYSGVAPNDASSDTYRDSFQLANANLSSSSLLNLFTAINSMGLQQKLLWNCSFRVLHTRPGGFENSSTAPKSLTEVIMAHNRSDGSMTKTVFPSINKAQRKPFIHLMSTHPNMTAAFPNKTHLEHLYPLVSDSTGGSHDATLTNNRYDYTDEKVRTSSMGDTYAVDPFDSMMNTAILGNDNPLRTTENLSTNSGIEIDLISELSMVHTDADDYDLNSSVQPTGSTDFVNLQQTMPTANELTLPGDHELVFVLYTGHYGAKMYDTQDVVDTNYIPPVAGCHLTATLEINRPSERISSPNANVDNQHYGKQVVTYAIPSTK